MPNDAKLGLVVGVGLVVLIAVVFFRKDTATANPTTASVAAAFTPAGLTTSSAPRSQFRPVAARTASTTQDLPAPQRHIVQAGDSLYSLARHYYQNDARFVEIFRANQDVLSTPDPLTPGTVLVIPSLPE